MKSSLKQFEDTFLVWYSSKLKWKVQGSSWIIFLPLSDLELLFNPILVFDSCLCVMLSSISCFTPPGADSFVPWSWSHEWNVIVRQIKQKMTIEYSEHSFLCVYITPFHLLSIFSKCVIFKNISLNFAWVCFSSRLIFEMPL